MSARQPVMVWLALFLLLAPSVLAQQSGSSPTDALGRTWIYPGGTNLYRVEAVSSDGSLYKIHYYEWKSNQWVSKGVGDPLSVSSWANLVEANKLEPLARPPDTDVSQWPSAETLRQWSTSGTTGRVPVSAGTTATVTASSPSAVSWSNEGKQYNAQKLPDGQWKITVKVGNEQIEVEARDDRQLILYLQQSGFSKEDAENFAKLAFGEKRAKDVQATTVTTTGKALQEEELAKLRSTEVQRVKEDLAKAFVGREVDTRYNDETKAVEFFIDGQRVQWNKDTGVATFLDDKGAPTGRTLTVLPGSTYVLRDPSQKGQENAYFGPNGQQTGTLSDVQINSLGLDSAERSDLGIFMAGATQVDADISEAKLSRDEDGNIVATGDGWTFTRVAGGGPGVDISLVGKPQPIEYVFYEESGTTATQVFLGTDAKGNLQLRSIIDYETDPKTQQLGMQSILSYEYADDGKLTRAYLTYTDDVGKFQTVSGTVQTIPAVQHGGFLGFTFTERDQEVIVPEGTTGIGIHRKTGDFVDLKTGEKVDIEDPEVQKKYKLDAPGEAKKLKEAAEQNEDNFDKQNDVTNQETFGGFAAVIGTLGGIVQVYNEYKGIAALGALFTDEEDLAERRAETNEKFCKTVILGGTQCWASKLCASKIKAKPGDGTLVGRQPVGPSGITIPVPVAHVEAERSLPISFIDDEGRPVTQWLYRWTFYVRNPTNDDLRYNILFTGPGVSYTWWPEPQELSSGAAAGQSGSAAIPVTSTKDYRQICITLKPSIPAYDGKTTDSVCNSIIQYEGGATAPYGPPPNATGPLPGLPGLPGEQPPEEGRQPGEGF
jgi:hypothetical protein